MKIKFKESFLLAVLSFSPVYSSTASETPHPLDKKVGSLGSKLKSMQQKKSALKQEKTATGLAAITNLNSLLHGISEGKNISGFCQPEVSDSRNQNFIKKAGGHLDVILEPCFSRLYNATLSYYKTKSRFSFIKLSSFCKNVASLSSILVDFYQVRNNLADGIDSQTSGGAQQKSVIEKNFFKLKDCVQSVRNSLEKRAPSSKNQTSSNRSQELKQTFDELGFR